MKKRSANLLRLIHMHSKHIHRAPRWQVALAVVACAFLTKWAPAQTEVADTKPAATAGKSAQSVKTSKFDITQPVGDTYAAAPSLAIEQARVVIYRPRRTDEKAGVISVYLNERYHTSLQQDAFATHNGQQCNGSAYANFECESWKDRIHKYSHWFRYADKRVFCIAFCCCFAILLPFPSILHTNECVSIKVC
jgi:hypothetical protein